MSKEKLDEKDLENVSGGAGMRSVSRESEDERADENHEEERDDRDERSDGTGEMGRVDHEERRR
tara:strand:+ start:2320 stop:2511 length:192 start_codon:yes stop_codon:yes gene_type:complete